MNMKLNDSIANLERVKNTIKDLGIVLDLSDYELEIKRQQDKRDNEIQKIRSLYPMNRDVFNMNEYKRALSQYMEEKEEQRAYARLHRYEWKKYWKWFRMRLGICKPTRNRPTCHCHSKTMMSWEEYDNYYNT